MAKASSTRPASFFALSISDQGCEGPEEGVMRENLALPLVLATVFTAGCILIQRLEQYAECVEDVLTSAFLIVAGVV